MKRQIDLIEVSKPIPAVLTIEIVRKRGKMKYVVKAEAIPTNEPGEPQEKMPLVEERPPVEAKLIEIQEEPLGADPVEAKPIEVEPDCE